MGDGYESVVMVKSEVFIFRIPPLSTNRGHRAADWKLDVPDWSGRLRLVSLDGKLELKLEDKSSGNLFAKCPIDTYPGPAIEPVTDSSRYFVIKLLNENGQSAFIGLGFADRGDAFDMNVALQDHFKYIAQEKQRAADEVTDVDKPKLDLAFKEGQTITVNIGSGSKKAATQRPRPSSAAAGGQSTSGIVPLLPPPPRAGSSSGAGTPSNRPITAPPAGKLVLGGGLDALMCGVPASADGGGTDGSDATAGFNLL